MGDLLVTVTIPHISNIPRDSVTNTFAVHVVGEPDQADLDAIHDAIIDFYTVDVPETNQAIDDLISNGFSRAANACVLKTYDITGKLGYIIDPETGKKKVPNHGSPIDVSSFTLLNPGGAPLPEECSLVLTLRAEGWEEAAVEAPDDGDIGTETNRPRQRHSGRNFIGPVGTNVLTSLNGKARPTGQAMETIGRAAVRLSGDIDTGAGDRELSVWSRMDGTLRQVTHFEVDDAWDTQRRRGVSATVRERRNAIVG